MGPHVREQVTASRLAIKKRQEHTTEAGASMQSPPGAAMGEQASVKTCSHVCEDRDDFDHSISDQKL